MKIIFGGVVAVFILFMPDPATGATNATEGQYRGTDWRTDQLNESCALVAKAARENRDISKNDPALIKCSQAEKKVCQQTTQFINTSPLNRGKMQGCQGAGEVQVASAGTCSEHKLNLSKVGTDEMLSEWYCNSTMTYHRDLMSCAMNCN